MLPLFSIFMLHKYCIRWIETVSFLCAWPNPLALYLPGEGKQFQQLKLARKVEDAGAERKRPLDASIEIELGWVLLRIKHLIVKKLFLVILLIEGKAWINYVSPPWPSITGNSAQWVLFITMLKYRKRLSTHFLSFVISFTDTCSG